jgi:hypothetical protein
LYLSTRIPAGIDITPYAMKNANGRKAENVKLNLKLLIMSGLRAPKMFVIKEMTKKVKKINPTK